MKGTVTMLETAPGDSGLAAAHEADDRAPPTETPPPASPADAFQLMLEEFRLQHLSLVDIENTPPWSVEVRRSHGLYCYMVIDHPARLIVPPDIDAVIHPGDLAIVIDGAGHTLESLGDAGPTRLLSSHQIYDRESIAPLLRLLPVAIVNRGTDGRPSIALTPIITMYQMTTVPIRSTDMGVLIRLGELAFIQTAQTYIDTILPQTERQQLGGDLLQIGGVIMAMKRDLKRNWTLRELCMEARIAKTRLVETFARTVGRSPKKHLAHLRMVEAAALLKEGVLSIAQVAHQVGYLSDVPFNRAFKRHYGVPPGIYRSAARM